MPSLPSDGQFTQAVFDYVKDGAYPEDTNIVSAELPSSALQSLSELLEQARAEVKVRTQHLYGLSSF